jgi:hypothetical protein
MNMDVNKLSGPELVKEYNARSGKPPIKRFGTIEDGRRRLKALLSNDNKPSVVAGLVGEFGVRPTTNRAKLLRKFEDVGLGRKVLREDLMMVLYRAKGKEHRGAFNQVINGLLYVIDTKHLPFRLAEEKNKETKEVTYAINRK